MGRKKYDHIPGNIYVSEWIDYHGESHHCVHLIVEVKNSVTGRLMDEKYTEFCVYVNKANKSGFGVTARTLNRAGMNYLALHGITMSDATHGKQRLTLLLLLGTTVRGMLEKGLARYTKYHYRYRVKLDCDLIQSLIGGSYA